MKPETKIRAAQCVLLLMIFVLMALSLRVANRREPRLEYGLVMHDLDDEMAQSRTLHKIAKRTIDRLPPCWPSTTEKP